MRAASDTDRAMERYAAGEDAAFARLYDSLAPRILGYLIRHTNDPRDAEDLLQQTMLQIHRGRGRFIAGAEVTPWAFTIARHLLVDRLRRKHLGGGGVDASNLETRPSEGPGADDVVHARQLAICLERAMSDLPESQRLILELVKDEGLSFIEAAQVLGTTVGAVKARAHRAYQTLRAGLAQPGTGLRRSAR